MNNGKQIHYSTESEDTNEHGVAFAKKTFVSTDSEENPVHTSYEEIYNKTWPHVDLGLLLGNNLAMTNSTGY